MLYNIQIIAQCFVTVTDSFCNKSISFDKIGRRVLCFQTLNDKEYRRLFLFFFEMIINLLFQNGSNQIYIKLSDSPVLYI